jgi:hypothetical protein
MVKRPTPTAMKGSALRRDRHVVQFQLGVLELERTRREHERRAAMQKVAEVEQRLRQIDAQIRERQDVLERDQRYVQYSIERP